MDTSATLALAFVLLGTACGRGETPGESDPVPTNPSPASAPAGDPEVVAVDWMGQGVLYAAKVGERRGELTEVTYANGEREWVEPSRVRELPDLSGSEVFVWTPRGAQSGTVIATRDFLVQVRFANGTHSWYGKDQLYALQGAPPNLGGGERGGGGASYPLRAPADPATIREGARILCYWHTAGELVPQYQWLAEVVAVGEDDVQVKYLWDESPGRVLKKHVLRVFEPVEAVSPGMRVWLAGMSPLGIVRGQDERGVRVEVGGEERVVPMTEIAGVAPPVTADQLSPGTHVTVLWQDQSMYPGTVRSVAGDQVTVAWHDGSTPTPVPLGDVVETWEAAEDGAIAPPAMPGGTSGPRVR